MNHLITSRAGDELRLLYQDLSQHRPGQAPGLDRVRRTAIGMAFPTEEGRDSYGYACTVAERCYWPRNITASAIRGGKAPERQYVVLDEAGASSLFSLLEDATFLKDRYLSDFVACPNAPASAVEALRRAEGLTHYPDDPPQILRQKWPGFVSQSTVAFVRDTPLPDEAVLRTDLNTLWERELQHPDDGLPIFGSAAEAPLKALYLLGSTRESNYSTSQAAQGVRTGDMTVLSALWLAVKALEATLWAGQRTQTDPRERLRLFKEKTEGGSVTGY
jgi:hypothetical protein